MTLYDITSDLIRKGPVIDKPWGAFSFLSGPCMYCGHPEYLHSESTNGCISRQGLRMKYYHGKNVRYKCFCNEYKLVVKLGPD